MTMIVKFTNINFVQPFIFRLLWLRLTPYHSLLLRIIRW